MKYKRLVVKEIVVKQIVLKQEGCNSWRVASFLFLPGGGCHNGGMQIVGMILGRNLELRISEVKPK